MKNMLHCTILIVDDEPANLEEIEDVFKNSNWDLTIIKSPNGQIALKMAQTKAPDLIITDWDMPQMNGIELIKELGKHEETRHIPVIMFTGVMTTSENLDTALEAGAIDYIRKPLDKVELLSRTRTVLKLSHAFNMVKVQKSKLEEKNKQLKEAAENLKTLKGLIPICAQCKKIRDDEGYWNQLELFITEHTDAEFSHGICPDCMEKATREIDKFFE